MVDWDDVVRITDDFFSNPRLIFEQLGIEVTDDMLTQSGEMRQDVVRKLFRVILKHEKGHIWYKTNFPRLSNLYNKLCGPTILEEYVVQKLATGSEIARCQAAGLSPSSYSWLSKLDANSFKLARVNHLNLKYYPSLKRAEGLTYLGGTAGSVIYLIVKAIQQLNRGKINKHGK